MFGLFKKKNKQENKESLHESVQSFKEDLKEEIFIFDKDKQEKLRNILISKSKNNLCEFCNENNWTISTELVRPLIYHGKTFNNALMGGLYPKAMIICTNCGNTKFFNAVVLGIETQDS